MNKALVSLIIPIYNAEKYLTKCIDSILNQTYSNIEIILVNDGSSDCSGSICEEIKAKDSRVKVIHQKNSGPSTARNTGILKSKGDYLQFVDADDYIESTMVKKLMSASEKKVDLVICGYYNNGEESKINIPEDEGIYALTEFMSCFPKLFKLEFINSPGNKLYSTKIIKENSIKFNINVSNGEDLLFNIEYIKYCKFIKIIKLPLYHYNLLMNPSSLTKGYIKDYFENRKIIFKGLSTFLNKYGEESSSMKKILRQTYSGYIISSIINIFHPQSQLSFSEKRNYLTQIVEDKWVVDNINLIEKGKKRGIIVRFLLKNKLTSILSLYFKTLLIVKKYKNT